MSSCSGSNNSSARYYQSSNLQGPPRLLTSHFAPQRSPCYNVPVQSDVMMSNGALRTQTALPHYTKYLESKIASIQEERQNVMTENMNLNNQVSRAVIRVQELEEALLRERAHRWETPRRETDNEQRRIPSSKRQHHRGVNTLNVGYLDASCSTENPSTADGVVQTTKVAVVVEPPPPQLQPDVADASCDPSPDYVSIPKSELDNLESDMKSLRNSVRAKEEQWDQALEREHNYRKHLARLSVEFMTARQLSETRYNEMQILLQKFTDKKDELKEVQKELAIAKKALSKYQKRQNDTSSSNVQDLCAGDDDAILENQLGANQNQSLSLKQQRPKTRSTKIQGISPRIGPRVKEPHAEQPKLITV